MKNGKFKISDKDMDFFITTIDEKGRYVIYESEKFRLSEIDLINLIKICNIERRSVLIGNKLLDAYRDCTNHRKEITEERLNLIGIKNKDEHPTIRKRAKKK